MNVDIKGSLQQYLQSEKWYYDPSRGFYHQLFYEGASKPTMQALWRTYVEQGIACTLTYNKGGRTVVDIDDAALDEAIDTWELAGNTERRDLLSHPTVLTNATSDQIALLRKHLEANDTPIEVFVNGTDGCESLNGGEVPFFYILYQNGQSEFIRDQYVLRHKTNVANNYAANVADENVGCVYSTAQLISEISDAGLWEVPCPSRLQYKINNIAAPTYMTNYLWGWLKSPSTESRSPLGRIDIVTEYTLDQWSTKVYGTV